MFGTFRNYCHQNDSKFKILLTAKKMKNYKNKHVCSRELSKDCLLIRDQGVIDPAGVISRRWSKLFSVACIVSLFIDPLFLMVPEVKPEFCITNGSELLENLIIIRSVIDVFYMINIIVQFRTAYVEPSSRVFGRGVLVFDLWKIGFRYLKFSFWIDVAASFPLPQVFLWVVIPKIRDMMISEYKTALRFIPLTQFLLRLVLAYPLSMKMVAVTGIMSRTAWFSAAYNLLFILLASYSFDAILNIIFYGSVRNSLFCVFEVAGSSWYLLAVQRQLSCWRSLCSQNSMICQYEFFDCSMIHDQHRNSWIQSSNITDLCSPNSNYFQFGIYSDGITNSVTSVTFFYKLFYVLWWGLMTLCSIGQNLLTSIYIGENLFSILLATLGLFNYALLMGNVQGYLLSATARLDKYIVESSDTEQWMHHRQLPPNLRECIRKYDRYRWVATKGIDEQRILTGLPPDLRRQIKRYVCLDLVRRVPLFNQMDDRLLDAVCERLKSTLYTEGTLILSEGDPLTEMLFVVRGYLHSHTTGDGRIGFFNSSNVGPGEFSGDSLLTWALNPPPNGTLPSSTFTLKAITDVEAFSLGANDLKFAALQFRRMHSKELKDTLRFYSHQWRLWAACFIQAVWRRRQKNKLLGELNAREHSDVSQPGSSSMAVYEEMEVFVPRPGSSMAVYAARVTANIRKGSSNRFGPDSYALRL